MIERKKERKEERKKESVFFVEKNTGTKKKKKMLLWLCSFNFGIYNCIANTTEVIFSRNYLNFGKAINVEKGYFRGTVKYEIF